MSREGDAAAGSRCWSNNPVGSDGKGCVRVCTQGRRVDVCLYYWGITCAYLFCTCQYSNISMNKAHMHFPDPLLAPVCDAGLSVPAHPAHRSRAVRAAGRNGGMFWGGGGCWQSGGAQLPRAWLETQL